MFKTRVLLGALLIAAVVGLCVVDDRVSGPWQLGARVIRHDGVIVALVLALLSVIATLEICRLAEAAGHAPPRFCAAFSNYIFVLIPYFAHNGLLWSTADPVATNNRLTLLWLLISFAAACVLIAGRQKTEHALADIAVSLLIVIYLGFLPTYLLRLRTGGSVWVMLYVVAVVKCSDIGAYFTGYAFGRHKLIEWLSPKKTVEGFAGGMIFSIAVSLILTQIVGIPTGSEGRLLAIRPGGAALFGLLLALLGQAGDLLESLFKRDAQAKDSAAVIPAFGGILDVLDSLLPTAPVAYYILIEWNA